MRNVKCGMWLVVWGVLGLIGAARAADVKVEAVYSQVSNGGWVPVRVSAEVPASGGVIWVRDARGGVEFGRVAAAGEKDVLMSLPLVNAAALQGENGLNWRVRVRVGKIGEETKSEGSGEEVTVGGGLSAREVEHGAVLGDEATSRPAGGEVATFRERELLNAPAMCLAGVDVLTLSTGLAQKMSAERAAALIAVGVRFAYAHDIPPGGALAGLQWTRVEKEGRWVAPVESVAAARSRALEPPRVVEKDLTKVPGFVPKASAGMKSAALWITPAVIALIVLARFISARAWVIAAIVGAGAAVGAGALVWGLTASVGPEKHVLAWTTRGAPGCIEIKERVELWNTMRGMKIDVRSNDAVPLMPVVSSGEAWLKLGEEGIDRLVFDERETGARYISEMKPWQGRSFFSRSAAVAWALPASATDESSKRDFTKHGIDLGAGVEVVGGYIHRPGQEAEELTQWIGRPEDDPTMNAWYQLRFWGGRRYRIIRQGSDVMIVDFGEGAGNP